MPYYAIRHGQQTGVFNDYDSVRPHVDYFPNARHKRFDTFEEAYLFVHRRHWVGGRAFAEVHSDDGRVERYPMTDGLAAALEAL